MDSVNKKGPDKVLNFSSKSGDRRYGYRSLNLDLLRRSKFETFSAPSLPALHLDRHHG